MNSTFTVVLDESCAHLEDTVAALAPVEVFRRADGFRIESTIAAAELRQLLDDRGILGRAFYIAPSFAGFTALLLASEHPGSLAGILLVDPSHPRQGSDALQILADAPATTELERMRSLLAGFGPAWEQSCRAVAEIRNLGDLTLRVLAGGKFDLVCELPEEFQVRLIRSRHAMLSEYCTLSRDATLEVVETAGHDIARQAPEAVLSAVRRILSTKNEKPIPSP
jgi:pimeloyl-ACP methyl ester carboxylesterase